MDPLEAAPRTVEATWAMVALLCAYSVYKAIPAFVERYHFNTTKRAESVIQKINGVGMDYIKRALAADLWFKEEFFDKRLAGSYDHKNLVENQASTLKLLRDHSAEDREAHERIRTLEVEMTEVKGDLREIKETVTALGGKLDVAKDEIRDRLEESERRVIDKIAALYERRREPRIQG